nr:hypothetical protein [Sphingobium fuliginis]
MPSAAASTEESIPPDSMSRARLAPMMLARVAVDTARRIMRAASSRSSIQWCLPARSHGFHVCVTLSLLG